MAKQIAECDQLAKLLGTSTPTDKKGESLVLAKVVERPEKWWESVGTKVICFSIGARVCNRTGEVMVKGYGSDDNTYNNYPTLGRILPRCYTVVQVKTDDGYYQVPFHGFYKFGSRNVFDEDTDIVCQINISDEQLKDATQVVVTTKSNGKAVVVTAMTINEHIIIWGGSKTSHYPLRLAHLEEDLETLKEMKGTELTYNILANFVEQFRSLEKEGQNDLITYFLAPELSVTRTLCGEYEDGMHIVTLKEQKPHITWFGFIENRGAIDDDMTLCHDFQQSAKLLDSFGFPHVPFTVYTTDQFLTVRDQLRWNSGEEGYVIHWQKETDGKIITVGMEKFKTWWYVFIRLIREFINSKYGLEEGWAVRLLERMLTRNQNYMKLSDTVVHQWYLFGCNFITWFLLSGREKSAVMFMENSDGMGNLWQSFLQETKRSDKVDPELEIDINLSDVLEKKQSMIINSRKLEDAKGILVLVQGISGLVKSVGDIVAEKMKDIKALEQDTYVKTLGPNKAGKACLKRCRDLMIVKTPLLLLQSNNTNSKQYESYVRLAREMKYYVISLIPNHYNDPHFGLCCLQSILRRKNGNSTLVGEELTKQFHMCLSFISLFQPATEGLLIDRAITWEWLTSEYLATPLLEEVIERYRYYLSRLDGDDTFSTEPMEATEIISGLQLETADYDGHVPLEENAELLRRKCQSLVAQLRRHMLQVPSAISAQPRYYGVFWDDQTKQRMKSLLVRNKEVDLRIEKSKEYIDHVTLIHQSDYEARPQLLEVVKAYVGEPVSVNVVGVAIRPGSIIAMMVELVDQYGNSLNQLVLSGYPHISVKMMRKIQPIESITLIRDLTNGHAPETDKMVMLETPITYGGIVQSVG